MTKPTRIISPTDFSPTSSHAVDQAATLAHALGARLVLLHVIPEVNYPMRSFGMPQAMAHIKDELLAKARETLQQRAQQLEQSHANLEVRGSVIEGEPHEVILDSAKTENADMIVMGTHGHTGLARALLGSTAEKVVRLADCPVLTVRTPS